MAFIGQSAPDIRNKLQRLDGLQNYSLQDLVKEADKIFNKRETPEEKENRIRKMQEEREDRRDKRRNRELSRILATVVNNNQKIVQELEPNKQSKNWRNKNRTQIRTNQCAYCKETGHWIKDCPNRSQIRQDKPS